MNELYALRMPSGQLATALGTVIELHVGRTLAQLIDASSVADSRIGEAMLKKLEIEMTQSWKSRQHWLKSGFGVVYAGVAASEQFSVLVELRNSVVHGDGALSQYQEADGTVKVNRFRKSLKDVLDAKIHGRLFDGPETKERMIGVARSFVAHFDDCLLSVYPNAARF